MNKPNANKQIIDEAAEWFVEFSTGDADQGAKQRFDAWLRQSPEHVRMYLELLPIWDDGAIPLPHDMTTAEELIALARAQDNVVPLERVASPEREVAGDNSGNNIPPLPRRYALAASIVMALLFGAWAVWFKAYRVPTYATDLGQQRSLMLVDGSTVVLNTQSRIRVNFTKQSRDVELLQGQAMFLVAKDSARPFTVSSDSTRVRAVGTQFDVYRKTSGTTITVLEGRVSVASSPARTPNDPAIPDAVSTGSPARREQPVLVSAGEQITLSGAAIAVPRPADVALATAWTEGRLIFEATPLPEVAEEFNRYNERRIVVEDEALRDFHVNGSFRSSDPTSLLRFLNEQPGLSVRESASDIRISHQ